MNMAKVMPLLKKYEVCPKCGNRMLGNGQGSLRIEDNTFTRTCKCGFKITVDEDDKEV